MASPSSSPLFNLRYDDNELFHPPNSSTPPRSIPPIDLALRIVLPLSIRSNAMPVLPLASTVFTIINKRVGAATNKDRRVKNPFQSENPNFTYDRSSRFMCSTSGTADDFQLLLLYTFFPDKAFYSSHLATRKHANKIWTQNSPICRRCPYVPTSWEKWVRHQNGRNFRLKSTRLRIRSELESKVNLRWTCTSQAHHLAFVVTSSSTEFLSAGGKESNLGTLLPRTLHSNLYTRITSNLFCHTSRLVLSSPTYQPRVALAEPLTIYSDPPVALPSLQPRFTVVSHYKREFSILMLRKERMKRRGIFALLF
eukprot:IDg5408t1